MINKCGCEYDEKCTLISLCKAQDMVMDDQDPLQDYKNEIVEYAQDWMNGMDFGSPLGHDQDVINLREAITRYVEELGDGE